MQTRRSLLANGRTVEGANVNTPKPLPNWQAPASTRKLADHHGVRVEVGQAAAYPECGFSAGFVCLFVCLFIFFCAHTFEAERLLVGLFPLLRRT